MVVSLLLRGPAPRHAEQMVNAAGLAVLAIGLTGVIAGVIGCSCRSAAGGDELLPNGWELVRARRRLRADRRRRGRPRARAGLPRRGQLPRSWSRPAFSVDETLLYWPLLILLVGLGAMFTGLRPRSPLPPEPSAYHDRQRPARLAHGRGEPCCACAMIRPRA